MTYRDAAVRAAVTFVVGATASPIGSAVFNIAWWQAAGTAGVAAVINLVGRLGQAWLQKHPEAL